MFTLVKKQITANYGARHLLRGLSHGTVPRLHCWLATPQDTNMGKSVTTFHSRGSTLRPFPRVLLCPLNISKIMIVKCNGCSLDLNISCSSVFWGVWAGLFSMGKQSIRKICPCLATPCYKILGWDAPRSP